MNLNPEWQIRRLRFNHDWFQNVFITKLQSLIKTPHDAIIRKQIAKRIAEWDSIFSELQKLIDDLSYGMSPARLFEQNPLVNLPEEHKKWMVPLLERYWRKENDIDNKQKFLQRNFDAVNQAFGSFKSKFTKSIETADDTVAFCDICLDFSIVISNLRDLSVLP